MNEPQVGKSRIVIVGGGAGGLELATRLGDKYGRKGKLDVTLIERNRTHVWKPNCTRSPPGAWIYQLTRSTISRNRTGMAFAIGSGR